MDLEKEIFEAVKDRLAACGSLIRPEFIMEGITPIVERYKNSAQRKGRYCPECGGELIAGRCPKETAFHARR